MACFDASNDDPFGCFDDSSSDNSSSDSSQDAESSISRDERFRLMAQSNRRMEHRFQHAKIVAREKDAARWRLPIKSSKYEVFDCTFATTLPKIGSGDARYQREKGMRALVRFSPGDEILREGAVMRIPNQQAATSQEEAETLHAKAVHTAFEGLSKETQNAVCNLSFASSNDNTASALSVYATNGFQLGDKETEGGLFLTISRINHSCRPNTHHVWRPDLQQMLIVATKDIAVGQEICTIYGGVNALYRDTAGRRHYLYSQTFSFFCQCEMCLEGNTLGGDDRMRRIRTLQDDIYMLAGTKDQVEIANKKIVECLELLGKQEIGTAPILKSFVQLGYDVPKSHAGVVLT